jgi:hypothetical protein
MTDAATPTDPMQILSGALPFLKRYDDAIVVVKYGGHAMGEEETALRFGRDIALLEQVGVSPVVVHGGGPQINAMLKRLNVKSTFVQGLRVTDEEMLDVVEMVLAGPVNKQVAEAITRAGVLAVGISGKDGGLIRARKLNRTYRDPDSNIERVLDLGYVGEPASVDPRVLRLLIGADIVPRGRAGRRGRGRADLQHQRRHGRRGDRRFAGCRAPADADRRARRSRPREAADPGDVGGRGEARHRGRLDLGRHDPEGRDLHVRGRARREGRGDPGRAGAARSAARIVHRWRGRHADPPLTRRPARGLSVSDKLHGGGRDLPARRVDRPVGGWARGRIAGSFLPGRAA